MMTEVPSINIFQHNGMTQLVIGKNPCSIINLRPSQVRLLAKQLGSIMPPLESSKTLKRAAG